MSRDYTADSEDLFSDLKMARIQLSEALDLSKSLLKYSVSIICITFGIICLLPCLSPPVTFDPMQKPFRRANRPVPIPLKWL